MSSLTVGVLSIQGDVHENILSLNAAIDDLDIDAKAVEVKTPDEISSLDGLIIPGGTAVPLITEVLKQSRKSTWILKKVSKLTSQSLIFPLASKEMVRPGTMGVLP